MFVWTGNRYDQLLFSPGTHLRSKYLKTILYRNWLLIHIYVDRRMLYRGVLQLSLCVHRE